MKIGYLSADWSNFFLDENGHETPGGSGWYRCHLPAGQLNANGIDAIIAEQCALTSNGIVLKDKFGVEHDDCDVIVMQRLMNSWGADLVMKARAAGQVVINDVDDWYWGLHPDNYASKTTDPTHFPLCNRDHYKDTIKASDAVTVSSQFLKDQIESWGVPTFLVRNAIDLARWTPRPMAEVPAVGWVGGTSHRSRDLETLKGILGPFINWRGLVFHHSGHIDGVRSDGSSTSAAWELAGVDINRCSFAGLAPISEYPELFKFFDIGIVPLNDVPFNHAKSWIKGLEYAASGIPFIAQDVPEYRTLAEEYGIGRVVRKPKEWRKALECLVDLDTRVHEAAVMRERLPELDIEKRWVDWLEVYQEVVPHLEHA